jgi:outer membrane lipoprotein-sorting protein
MAHNEKTYALIYIGNRKPIKRSYDTSSKAFYDYEDRGCVKVELYDGRGRLLSYKIRNNTNNEGIQNV